MGCDNEPRMGYDNEPVRCVDIYADAPSVRGYRAMPPPRIGSYTPSPERNYASEPARFALPHSKHAEQENTRFRSKFPVVFTNITIYAGSDGEHVLGWTPGDSVVLHPDVISRVAYQVGMDTADMMEETFEHEAERIGHLRNPYASESGNRAAVAASRASRGKPLSSLHMPYL